MMSQKTSRRMNAGVSESFLFTFGLIVGRIAEGLKRSCLPWTRWYWCPTRLRVSECLDHIHIWVDYSGHLGDSVITWTSENTKKRDRSGFQWPSHVFPQDSYRRLQNHMTAGALLNRTEPEACRFVFTADSLNSLSIAWVAKHGLEFRETNGLAVQTQQPFGPIWETNGIIIPQGQLRLDLCSLYIYTRTLFGKSDLRISISIWISILCASCSYYVLATLRY
jgi:hypothetical protein